MAKKKMRVLTLLGISLVILVPLLVLGLIFFGEDFVEAKILQGIESGTGLRAEAQFLDFDIGGRVTIRELKLYNRPHYPDALFYDIPEVNVRFDTWAFLLGNRTIERVFIYIRELQIVKNEEGLVNLTERESKGLDDPIQTLVFKLDKVIFKDYSVNFGPAVQTFNVDLEKTYQDVTGFKDMGGLIGFEALRNSALARMLNLSPQEFLQQNVMAPISYADAFVSGSVDRAAETAGGMLGGTVEAAGNVTGGASQMATNAVSGVTSAAGQLLQGAADTLSAPFSMNEDEPSEPEINSSKTGTPGKPTTEDS